MKKHIHAVGVIFEDNEGNILVLHRRTDKREGNTWGLVGGKIDSGETSKQAVLRETQEEIGYQIPEDDLQFEKSYSWEHDDAYVSFAVFRYKTEQDRVTIALAETESTEHLWVHPKALYAQKNLMAGLYPILKDLYGV